MKRTATHQPRNNFIHRQIEINEQKKQQQKTTGEKKRKIHSK